MKEGAKPYCDWDYKQEGDILCIRIPDDRTKTVTLYADHYTPVTLDISGVEFSSNMIAEGNDPFDGQGDGGGGGGSDPQPPVDPDHKFEVEEQDPFGPTEP